MPIEPTRVGSLCSPTIIHTHQSVNALRLDFGKCQKFVTSQSCHIFCTWSIYMSPMSKPFHMTCHYSCFIVRITVASVVLRIHSREAKQGSAIRTREEASRFVRCCMLSSLCMPTFHSLVLVEVLCYVSFICTSAMLLFSPSKKHWLMSSSRATESEKLPPRFQVRTKKPWCEKRGRHGQLQRMHQNLDARRDPPSANESQQALVICYWDSRGEASRSFSLVSW